MLNSLLIFDLGGGFNDMIKHLITIIEFTEKYNYKFTIRYCTARPQDNTYTLPDEIKNNDYMYDVLNLFDEKTFNIYKNYVSYNSINHEITLYNTYDFYSDKIKDNIFKHDKKTILDEVSLNINTIINNCNTPYVFIGRYFCFYIKPNITNEQYIDYLSTLIPNKKILETYEIIKTYIHKPYNFIHYRHENDLLYHPCYNKLNDFFVPKLDEILDINFFKNKNHNIYLASSNIQNLNNIGLLKSDIDQYSNIIYKKHLLPFFDENAWIDFIIGMEAEEILGFSYSGFSQTLNKIKSSNNYYNKLIRK